MTHATNVGPPGSRGRGAAQTSGSTPLPAGHSILSGEALLAEVTEAYPIEAPIACQLLRRGLHQTYLATTRAGRYIVLVYRAGWSSLSEISYELELLAHLAHKGVSVCEPIPDKQGRLIRPLAAPEGIRPLVLFTYAEDAPLSWDDEQHCYLAGRVAAAIHSASDDFVSQHARSGSDLVSLIDAPLAAIRPFLAHRPDDWAYLRGLAAELRARVEEASPGLDWGVCHGHLGGRTIHITDGQMLSVVEFDRCGPGWRAYDLAAIQWVALSKKSMVIWDSFLKGYFETRPLATADLAALPLLHALRHLSMLGEAAKMAGVEGTRRINAYLGPQLGFFRRWEAEHLAGGASVTPVGWIQRTANSTAPLAAPAPQGALLAQADGTTRRSHPARERMPFRAQPAGSGRAHAAPKQRPVLFPVIHAIGSAEAVLAAIGQAYALDRPLTCELVRAGLNDTYLLATPRARYVARVYGARWRSPSDIAYELELLVHLAARGVSVSTPIASREGPLMHPVLAPEGTRQLALFTYAEGTPLSWDKEEHSFLAGRMAAAIHTGSDDFVSRRARGRLDFEYLIETSLAAIRPFLAHHPDDWRYLEGFGARLRARAEEVAEAGLDWGPCHGDFEAKNMHISEGRTLMAFDFDMCGPGWRLYDLATLYRYAIGEGTRAIWDSFLKGYTETRSLTATDLAAIPLFWAFRHLSMLGVFARNVAEWGSGHVSGTNLGSWMTFFRQWEAENPHEAHNGSE